MKKGRLTLMMLTTLLAIPACGEAAAPASAITFDVTNLDMVVGQYVNIVATYPDDETIKWSSSEPTVATVNAGQVKALSEGTAIITAQILGTDDTASCTVKVTQPLEKFYIKEPTEIRVETTFNDTYGQHLANAAARLMKKEPNLTVTYQKHSGNYDKIREDILKGIPAGDYPDVTAAYPDTVADFITAQVANDMDPYINNEEYGWTEDDRLDFYDKYVQEGQHYSIPGTLSLPIAVSTEAMYYDADKIIGLQLDGINDNQAINEEYMNNLTWEELFDKFAPALLAYRETLATESAKKAFLDTSVNGYSVVGLDSDANFFITLAEQYGYGYTSYNSENFTASIDFVNDGMKTLMKKFRTYHQNKLFTTQGAYGNYVNKLFTTDALLLSIGSTGGAFYQFDSKNPKNIKIARLPHAEGKELKMIQQGPSIAFLSHGDENKSLASWLYYKELTTKPACASWAIASGYSPIRKSVFFERAYMSYRDVTTKTEKTSDMLLARNANYVDETFDYLFTSPVFKGSSEARVQVNGLVTAALADEIKSGQSLDDFINSLFNDAYSNTILKM